MCTDESKLLEKLFEHVVENVCNIYNLEKIGKFIRDICIEDEFDYHKGWHCVTDAYVVGYLLRSKSNPRELYIVSTCVDGVNVGTTVLYKPRFVSRVIRHMCMSEAQGKFTTVDEIEKWINECVDNVVSKLTPSEIRGDVSLALRNFFKIYNADVSINTMLRIGILRCVNSPNFEDDSIKCLPNLKELQIVEVEKETSTQNTVEVKDGKIIIYPKPGKYRVKYLDEELLIEITNDGKIIIYEIVDKD